MTDITVVTTFHQPGLEQYGQRFLDSFAERVDKKIKLLVYAESCQPNNPDPSQIEIFDAFEALPKLNEFKSTWGQVPKANGIPPDDIKARRPKDWHKEFKWDAVRFAHKVYSIFNCAKICGTDKLMWMDADTICHSSIDMKRINEILLPAYDICYVGRDNKWPECGLYSINLKSQGGKTFLKEFQKTE